MKATFYNWNKPPRVKIKRSKEMDPPFSERNGSVSMQLTVEPLEGFTLLYRGCQHRTVFVVVGQGILQNETK